MVRGALSNVGCHAPGAFAGRLLGCLKSLEDVHDRFKKGVLVP